MPLSCPILSILGCGVDKHTINVQYVLLHQKYKFDIPSKEQQMCQHLRHLCLTSGYIRYIYVSDIYFRQHFITCITITIIN